MSKISVKSGVKMKSNLLKNIVNNHSSNKDCKEVYKIDEFITLTVQQTGNKIAMWSFNEKSDRFVNLATKKYKVLLDGFKEIAEELYLKDNKYYITLANIKRAKVIGYCRVSTKGQLEGNGLESQKMEILNKYSNAEIYTESFTGTKTERPVFSKVIESLKEGDTLVVTKLDRLARNTVEGIQVIENLFAKGVSVHVLNVGLLENTTMGKFFLTTLLAVAEMERNVIVERTQAGKEVAKTKEGFTEGRPKKYTKEQLDNALSMLTINGGKYSYTEVERLLGISKSTLIRENNKRK